MTWREILNLKLNIDIQYIHVWNRDAVTDLMRGEEEK